MMEKGKCAAGEIISRHSDSHSISKDSEYYKRVHKHLLKKAEQEQKAKERQSSEGVLKGLFKRQEAKKGYADYNHRVKLIKDIAREGKRMVENDIRAAAAMYENIQELYRELPDHRKEEVYSHVIPFYEELESRIKDKETLSRL